jgi:hypothetical protein
LESSLFRTCRAKAISRSKQVIYLKSEFSFPLCMIRYHPAR